MGVHNIAYYRNLWAKYREFQPNKADSKRPLPQNLIVPITNFATDLLMGPTKWVYRSTGKVLVNVSNFFNPKFGSWLDDTWHDPISTETMIKIGKWVESKSRIYAVRSPVSLPFLYYLDRALIAFSRHTFIVAKDLNALLGIPKELKDFLSFGIAEAEKTTSPSSLTGKAWVWVKRGTAKVKDAFLALIQLIIKVVRVPLQYMPIIEPALAKFSAILERARERLHQALVSKVHGAIDVGEKKVRDLVMDKVAEVTARQTLRFAIGSVLRLGVGVGVYSLTKYAFRQITGAHDFPPNFLPVISKVLTIAGIYFGMRCITPTLDGFYEDYNENFDPEASTLFDP